MRLALLLVLLLAVCVGVYSFFARSQPRGPFRQVDLPALEDQVAREQPVGGTPDETVAFLRRVGFEDRYIRIRRYSAHTIEAGQVLSVEAWIPQPRVAFRGYERIVTYCRFGNDQRLTACETSQALAYEPFQHKNFEEVTPVPSR